MNSLCSYVYIKKKKTHLRPICMRSISISLKPSIIKLQQKLVLMLSDTYKNDWLLTKWNLIMWYIIRYSINDKTYSVYIKLAW